MGLASGAQVASYTATVAGERVFLKPPCTKTYRIKPSTAPVIGRDLPVDENHHPDNNLYRK